MKIEEEIQKLVDEDQIQEALLTLDANEAKVHDKAWYYSERGWILGMLERYLEFKQSAELRSGRRRYSLPARLGAQ